MRASMAVPGSRPQQEFFTFCHVCPGHCSVKATVEEGKVVDIVPDKESGLPNELCPVKKGRFSIPEVLHHPDRLKYPQKRVGARGEGKWERISWDEALDLIASKYQQTLEQHGPDAVAVYGSGSMLPMSERTCHSFFWKKSSAVIVFFPTGIPASRALLRIPA